LIIGGWIGTTFECSVWAGRLYYLVNIAVKGVSSTIKRGGLRGAFVGLGGIVNDFTKPSK
jgi:hypothetical protein